MDQLRSVSVAFVGYWLTIIRNLNVCELFITLFVASSPLSVVVFVEHDDGFEQDADQILGFLAGAL
jgi:hypothetical protein